MPKIMLVEDDTNLSEIYEARLRAEGYDIVATKDGEEALATAVKEHPDLIICDVMMPKISGFEMLDILRGTEGIKSTKVIMMTALSQAEDKARASSLGADRYLVKSQVTLEDVVKVTKDVLDETKPATTPPATPIAPATTAATATTPPATPAATPESSPLSPPTTTPQTTPATTPIAPVPDDIAKTMTEPVSDSDAATTPPATPIAPASASPSVPVIPAPVATSEPAASSPSPTPAPAPTDQATTPPVTTTSTDDTRTDTAEASVKTAEGLTSEQEQAAVGEQIKSFVGEQPVPEPNAGESLEAPPTTPSAPDVPSVPKDTTPAPSVTPAPAPTTTEDTDASPSVPVIPAPVATSEPAAPTEPATAPSLGPEPTEELAPTAPANDGVTIPGKKVIQPINDLNQKPDLDALLMKEQLAEEQRALTSSGPNGAVVSDQTAPKETQPGGYLQPAPADVGAATDPNNIAL